MNDPLPTHAKKVFQGDLFAIWQWEQELFDGSFRTFEKAVRVDAAFVLPVLPDNRLLLIKDEQPHREPILTLPGGKTDPGESPETTATRELLEETGYEVKELVPWFSFNMGAKVDCTFTYFIGRGATQVGESAVEAGEKITPQPHTLEDFVTALRSQTMYNPVMRGNVLESLVQDPSKNQLKTIIYGE